MDSPLIAPETPTNPDPDNSATMADRIRESVDEAVDRVIEVVKPRLRGWLHAGVLPLALAAGIVLVSLAPSRKATVASLVFSLTAVQLFGVSALYHRFSWSDSTRAVLRRLDHANIFLIIAGTYTPFAVLLLEPDQASLLLRIVWGGALLGLGFRLGWVGAPRWVYTPAYVALGWVAVFYIPPFLRYGGTAVLTLIVIGGALYTAGGVIYALKRPNPSPRWFGFHEVFHALTLAAFTVHYLAVSLVVYRS